MVVIRYENPKQYGSTQWFVQKQIKLTSGRRLRFMVDGKFNHDFINDESSMSGPSPAELRRYGVVTDEIPRNLIWHLFNAIFGNDEDRFLCINDILR